MLLNYELKIETDRVRGVIRLRLNDHRGAHLEGQTIEVDRYHLRDWQALLDTRRYLKRVTQLQERDRTGQPVTAQRHLERVGAFLGTEILGPKIMATLTAERGRRSLLISLPTAEADPLGAAFARVPWEIARPALGERQLMELGLIIRVVTPSAVRRDRSVAALRKMVSTGRTPLRVLLVYAVAPGARPLAMRMEREQLLRLFEDEILPRRRVEIDVLCHGVTPALLQEQLKASDGYHVIHWSGHGRHNGLEVLDEDGARSVLSGKKLVALIEGAGRFIPQLVYLSTCSSGTLMGGRDWTALKTHLSGRRAAEEVDRSAGRGTGVTREPTGREALDRAIADIEASPEGYSSTALELLACGVPQVVAMRYSVGDDYARELARWFYQRLLADPGEPSTESALELARTDVLEKGSPGASHVAVDHANAMMFGQAGRLLAPAHGRSEQMDSLRPQPQPLLPAGRGDLDPPARFVGRGQVLTRLNQSWLAPGGSGAAIVEGGAGLGKSTLAAEVIHLWHRRFDWVLAFQAKSKPISAEELFSQIHARLTLDSVVYYRKCEKRPSARVYLEPSDVLAGGARYNRMRINLLEALRDEAILLLLDGFEANVESIAGEAGFACNDPEWGRLLGNLATELPATHSRLLITSRRPVAELAGSTCLRLTVEPFERAETELFVYNNETLSELLFGDREWRALLDRVCRVCRGHPFALARIVSLTRDRSVLAEALDVLETKDIDELTDALELFIAERAA